MLSGILGRSSLGRFVCGIADKIFSLVMAQDATAANIKATTCELSVSAAMDGAMPISYQWFWSTSSGFTPGSATLLPGKTSLMPRISGLMKATDYYFVCRATDMSGVVCDSNQVHVRTLTARFLAIVVYT
jgi:hypothetical protein